MELYSTWVDPRTKQTCRSVLRLRPCRAETKPGVVLLNKTSEPRPKLNGLPANQVWASDLEYSAFDRISRRWSKQNASDLNSTQAQAERRTAYCTLLQAAVHGSCRKPRPVGSKARPPSCKYHRSTMLKADIVRRHWCGSNAGIHLWLQTVPPELSIALSDPNCKVGPAYNSSTNRLLVFIAGRGHEGLAAQEIAHGSADGEHIHLLPKLAGVQELFWGLVVHGAHLRE